MVDAFSTDVGRRLNMPTLGSELLNAAEIHAEKRGFGITDITERGCSWVLSRLTVEMESMPLMFTPYIIDTWIESVYRMFTNRNFQIRGEDGRVYGYARTVWALIDNALRQPQDLIRVYGEKYQSFSYPEKPCLIAPCSRIRPMKEAVPFHRLKAVYSDIDHNGHVNSIRYIGHICDLFDMDFYRTHRIQRLDVAYVAETYAGDELSFCMDEISDGVFAVEVRKGINADTTVVRAMVTFQPYS